MYTCTVYIFQTGYMHISNGIKCIVHRRIIFGLLTPCQGFMNQGSDLIKVMLLICRTHRWFCRDMCNMREEEEEEEDTTKEEVEGWDGVEVVALG